jgi:CubicO group peptidase (beta-lactamase class C family)
MDRTFFFQVGDPQRETVDHPMPAGGAASTLGDYGRFLEMIVNGGVAPDGTRILTQASIDEMETNQTEGLPVFGSSFRRNNQAPYGLGHWIDWTDEDGATMVSSSPGTFGFRPWVDWENDVFGVYLVHDTIDESHPDFGDPDRPNASGSWIIEMSAEAVGGSLPREFYGHRD